MGFKETYITDWKDKTIEYQEKQFYILEQFEYEKREYLCGCDINTIGKENLEVVFLYRLKDDIFEHVLDEKLFEELLMNVSGKLISEKILEIDKKYNNKE